MSVVKKFEACVMGSGGDYWPEMQESPSGGFVALADHEALLAKATRPSPCEHACESKAFEIEIRQLKAKADTADLLQIRVGEMAAEVERLTTENARLQSVIDEAKPKIYVDHSAKSGGDGSVEKPFNNFYDAIPAQQSPAVAVPDDSCTECGGRGEFVAMVNYEMDSNPCYKCGGTGKKINEIAYDINNKISIKCPECGTRTSTGVDVALKIIDLVGAQPSPRTTEQDSDGYVCGDNYESGLWSRRNIEAFIADGNRVGGFTEQDAREAVEKLDHVLKMNKDVMTNTGVVYVQQCRALLAKLNKPENG